jgi:D-3-phosphoglycerate dehydrogenase
LARLQELLEVTLHEGDMPLDTAGVIAMARGVDFIIADRSTPVPGEVFASLPGLKVVMRSAIDIRNIDVAAASQAGVLVTHAEAGFVQSVIELTLGLLVDLSRGVSRAVADYQAGRMPEIKVGRQLGGSTVGIIGYGRISRALAPMLATLGMKVLVSDPYAQVDDRRFIKLPLSELLGQADYVVCLAIANEETENLMDAAAFARMKPDAFFINMSRGNLIDEAALAKALTEGRIAGAAMDVARLPNVIATPHIGGLTPPASESQAFDTVHQVEALVKGEVPPGAANLESWTRRPT